MTVLLLRHAKAGRRRDWDGPDIRRPLSRKGQVQAVALVDVLEAFPVKRIVSSPYTRCVQTVVPIAETLGLEIETRRELGEAAGIHEGLPLVEELYGTTSIVCSHGDVVPALLAELARRDGFAVPDDAEFPKGSTWVLEDVRGRITEARYLPPPA